MFFIDYRRTAPKNLLRLPRDMSGLEALVAKTKARLVILDPITAFLDSSVVVSSDQSVRSALFPLDQLADAYQFVSVLVRHLNKKLGGHALYRGAGSIGFMAACRMAWLLAAHPLAPDRRRVLAQQKNNLVPLQSSLAFEVQNPKDVVDLQWLGKSDLTANQLVAATGRATWGTMLHQVRDFLARFLTDGPRTSRDIWKEANALGISQRTLWRARKQLKIRTERTWPDGRQVCYWALPGQALPPEVAAKDEESDLEPWLAPLREKYPPSTPLDDW